MKKLCLLFVLWFIFGMCLPVNGLEDAEDSDASSKTHLQSVIPNETLAELTNTDLYDSNMDGVELEAKPLIVIYNFWFWGFSDKPLAEIVEYAESENIIDYLVMDTPVVRIRKGTYQNKGMSISRNTFFGDEPPLFEEDLASGDANAYEISGKKRTVTNLYCFDGSRSMQGIVIFFLTTDGTFVRCYDYEYSAYQDFTLADFQKYGTEFDEYISAPETNYDENGSPLYGTHFFSDFVAAGGEYTPPERTDTNETDAADRSWVWITVCVGISAIVLLAGATGIVLYRKRKKQAV